MTQEVYLQQGIEIPESARMRSIEKASSFYHWNHRIVHDLKEEHKRAWYPHSEEDYTLYDYIYRLLPEGKYVVGYQFNLRWEDVKMPPLRLDAFIGDLNTKECEIIEVESRASESAVGQLLLYDMLFERSEFLGPKWKLRKKILLATHFPRLIEQLCERVGLTPIYSRDDSEVWETFQKNYVSFLGLFGIETGALRKHSFCHIIKDANGVLSVGNKFRKRNASWTLQS